MKIVGIRRPSSPSRISGEVCTFDPPIHTTSLVIRQSWGLPVMQDQRRSTSSAPFLQTSDSQALLPGSTQISIPPLATNPYQSSYDSGFDSSISGAHHMSPCYSASQFNSGFQPGYGPALDSSTFGAYNTAALTPSSAFDQQLKTQDPGLTPVWDVSAMQLPTIAAAVPYSTANDYSTFPPTESPGFPGWGEDGSSPIPTGTSGLPAGSDAYGHDNESSWPDPPVNFPRMEPALAHDLDCMNTGPATSSLGESTR